MARRQWFEQRDATGASPHCPGVILSAIGRPQRSTTAWIFVDLPPLERPIACASAPFSARGGSGRLCGGAVDHVKVPIGRLHQSFKQPPPYAFGRPTMEAIVDGGRGAVASGTILPPATGSQYMDDAAPRTSGRASALAISRRHSCNHLLQPMSSAHDLLGQPVLTASVLPGPCTAANNRPATKVKWSTKKPNSAWLPAQCDGPWNENPRKIT